jgi:hypothetical protein
VAAGNLAVSVGSNDLIDSLRGVRGTDDKGQYVPRDDQGETDVDAAQQLIAAVPPAIYAESNGRHFDDQQAAQGIRGVLHGKANQRISFAHPI